MTIDERQEIAEYLDIVKRNCQRLMRSVDMLQDKLGEMGAEPVKIEPTKTFKEEFLEKF